MKIRVYILFTFVNRTPFDHAAMESKAFVSSSTIEVEEKDLDSAIKNEVERAGKQEPYGNILISVSLMRL